MTPERRQELSEDGHLCLTIKELEQGWHFCHTSWDGLLIYKDDEEFKSCDCLIKWNIE